MRTPEGIVKDGAKKFFKEQSIFYFMVVPSGYGRQGLPDFITCIPVKITSAMVGKTVGVFGGFEAKAPGKLKNTSANQDAVLSELHNAGAVAVVFDNIQTLKEAVKSVKGSGNVAYKLPKKGITEALNVRLP